MKYGHARQNSIDMEAVEAKDTGMRYVYATIAIALQQIRPCCLERRRIVRVQEVVQDCGIAGPQRLA